MARAKPTHIAKNTDTAKMLSMFTEASVADSRPSSVLKVDAEQSVNFDAANIPLGERYRVGFIYEVPIHELASSPFNARHFYVTTDIDEMATSLMDNGQEQTAVGYIDGDKVLILDGVKRLRGARAGGIASLRVEIRDHPSSPVDAYLASRRLNSGSAQTVLDDAVKIKELIESGAISNQIEFAKMAGLSESGLSQSLAINRVPQRVMLYMKDRPSVCRPGFAYPISTIFPKQSDIDRALEEGEIIDEEALISRAIDIIDQVVDKKLTVKQVHALIKSKSEGPKRRELPASSVIRYQGTRGTLKVFESKRKIELSITNLPEDRLEDLRRKIEAVFAE